jgi:hypothetical protein
MQAQPVVEVTQKVTQSPKDPPRSAARLEKVGECLYRNPAGIFFGIVKAKNRRNVKRSLNTTDRATAQQRLADLRIEIRGGTTPAPIAVLREQTKAPISPPSLLASLSFLEVGERWLATQTDLAQSSKRRRRYSIKVVADAIGNLTIGELDKLTCERWAAKHAARFASRTFNMDLESLKVVLGYAKLHGIQENPAEHIERKTVRYLL